MIRFRNRRLLILYLQAGLLRLIFALKDEGDKLLKKQKHEEAVNLYSRALNSFSMGLLGILPQLPSEIQVKRAECYFKLVGRSTHGSVHVGRIEAHRTELIAVSTTRHLHDGGTDLCRAFDLIVQWNIPTGQMFVSLVLTQICDQAG